MAKTAAQLRGVAPVESGPATEEDRYYLPEEVVSEKLLRCSARWLKEMAYRREIPHGRVANRIAFRMEHIRAIQRMFEFVPATRSRRVA